MITRHYREPLSKVSRLSSTLLWPNDGIVSIIYNALDVFSTDRRQLGLVRLHQEDYYEAFIIMLQIH